MNAFPPGSRALVVGVHGSIGAMLARQLASSGFRVTGIDLARADAAPANVTVLQADATRPDAALRQVLGETRILVLAVSQHVLTQALPQLLPHLPADALLVETLSIKSPFAAWLADQPTTQAVLGINPMFSGDLDPAGRPLAAVPYRDAPLADAFIDLLRQWRLDVVTLTPAQHDEAMAMLQTVGHSAVLAFGQTLARSPLALDALLRLAPPPFRVMLALLARMTQNHPDVYWEIQADNPCSADARRRLLNALATLDDGVASDDHAGFHTALTALKEDLIADHPDYVDTSRRIFEFINQPPAPDTLPAFRAAIDRIDDQLIDLLGQRQALIGQVAHFKKTSQTPVMQPNRVLEVVQRCKTRGQRWHLRGELIEQLYRLIIEEACHIEYEHVGGPREPLLQRSAPAFQSAGVNE
ncbi:chorismate mutase [Chitiniphilus eburneus]|uniref:chorismate mutase n=1 Tax=Chitiniphilus eburneus TaxID=2571148 RepID=A0A4U0PHI4_9NEIS|nr:chorismate mutase [Chitiniphilus eburneus]TJZ67436.1 prephenate dehydrogenase/arogenate dehydrogenase family protein [Chitiniphilus eburneus]